MNARKAGRAVAAAAVAAACVVAAATFSRGGESARVELRGGSSDVLAWTGGKLMRVDRVTLRPTTRSLSIDLGPTAFAPDGSRLAVAGANAGTLRIVDLGRMQVARREVDLGHLALVDTLAWLDPSTIAAVTWGSPPRLLFVDVAKRRVVAQRPLNGVVFARAAIRGALVLLVGPANRVGASTLVTVDRARGVRSVTLAGVAAGYTAIGDSRSGDHRQIAPGLAVDPAARRAVVVPPAGRVAEIDLRSLAVAYHELTRPISLVGRLRDWLEPPAYAKSTVGPERHARWVGDDAVAVVSLEQVGIRKKEGEHRQLARAAGVELIDTSDWSVRTLDDRAGAVAVAGATVLVSGGPFAAGGGFSADDGPAVTGLRGFTTAAEERFRLFPSRHVGHVEAAGRYAYVTSRGSGVTHVVDAVAGRVVRTVRTPEHVFVIAR